MLPAAIPERHDNVKEADDKTNIEYLLFLSLTMPIPRPTEKASIPKANAMMLNVISSPMNKSDIHK